MHDACTHYAYINAPWSWCMCVRWIYLWSLILMYVNTMNVFVMHMSIIFDFDYDMSMVLNPWPWCIMHICMFPQRKYSWTLTLRHVSMMRQINFGRTNRPILEVGFAGLSLPWGRTLGHTFSMRAGVGPKVGWKWEWPNCVGKGDISKWNLMFSHFFLVGWHYNHDINKLWQIQYQDALLWKSGSSCLSSVGYGIMI